jgi:hypothetical protein
MGLVSANWDMQLLMLVSGALCVAGIWKWFGPRTASAVDHPLVLTLILIGLTVHLSTSGGMGMPGISQLLLLVCVVIVDRTRAVTPVAVSNPRGVWANAAGALTAAGLVATVIATGLAPVLNATNFIQAGDFESLRGAGSERAAQYYTLASEADPLDPIPWERLARVATSRWETASGPSRDRLRSEAVRSQTEAILRDPRNPRYYYEQGRIYWRAYQKDNDPEDLRSTIRSYGAATTNYPNSSLYQGSMSLAWQALGRTDYARNVARFALQLDELNRAAGHTDRYLPDDMLRDLRLIADQPAPEEEGD